MNITIVVRDFWEDQMTALPKLAYELAKKSKHKIQILTDSKINRTSNMRGIKIVYSTNIIRYLMLDPDIDMIHYIGGVFGALQILNKIRNKRLLFSVITNQINMLEVIKSLKLKDLLKLRVNVFLLYAISLSFLKRYLLQKDAIFVFSNNRSRNLGGEKSKIRLIEIGLNSKEYIKCNKEKVNRLRNKLKIPKNKKIISYIGHDYLSRGIDNLIKVFSQLDESFFLLLLLNKMPDGDIEKVRRLLRPVKPDRYILITEYVKNIKEYYHLIDILVLNYRNPCELPVFPLVLCEGLGSGTNVIVSKIGDIPELVSDGYNGYLISPNNLKELYNKIIEVANLKKDEVGLNAKNSVKRLDWKIISRKYEDIYNELKSSKKTF